MYAFCNRGSDKVKLLIWHLNGYWLLYKRVEKQRFQWPDWFEGDSLMLTHEQLAYLLAGLYVTGSQLFVFIQQVLGQIHSTPPSVVRLVLLTA